MDVRIVPKTRAFSRRRWAKFISTNMPEACAEKQCRSAGTAMVGSGTGCFNEPPALSPRNRMGPATIQVDAALLDPGTLIGTCLSLAYCKRGDVVLSPCM